MARPISEPTEFNGERPVSIVALQGELPVKLVDKPWGRTDLPPPFTAPDGRQIGEIWFEPPAALPELLVKYIFTSDKLSVQVHPSDEQTLAKGLGKQGKEECWFVLAAEPHGKLGIGFREPISHEAMRAAALDGSIEEMLVWHEVKAGDFFYIPANTVHAIGAGVTVVEVQQNSDITYRLLTMAARASCISTMASPCRWARFTTCRAGTSTLASMARWSWSMGPISGWTGLRAYPARIWQRAMATSRCWSRR
jgi:hypothetical protein